MSALTNLGIFTLCFLLSSVKGQSSVENAIPVTAEDVKEEPGQKDACAGVPTAIRGDRGWISSPGFTGRSYPNNANCQWLIVVPSGKAQLNFKEFSLESSRSCLFDSLRIHDGPSSDDPLIGRYCGTTIPDNIVGSSNSLTIVFTTDFIGQAPGFNVTFASSDMVGDPVDACTGVAASLSGSQGVIVSPGYLDGSYPSNAVCVWTITVPEGRIRLRFTEFEMEQTGSSGACQDGVIIRDGASITGLRLGTACGAGSPNEVISSSSSMTITFSSNDQVSGRGFRAEYNQIAATDVGSGMLGCNGQIFRLEQRSGLFTSPGYFVGAYPNSHTCRYQITVPQGQTSLQFMFFNLEQSNGCTNDYLEIYNGNKPDDGNLIGRYCGSNIPASGIVGNSRTLFIVFRTNSAVSATGFAAIYLTGGTPISEAFSQALETSQAASSETEASQSPAIQPPSEPARRLAQAQPPVPAAPANISPAQSNAAVIPDEVRVITRGVEETCLTAHNRVRLLHDRTRPLVYDSGLARGAAEWARQLAESDTFRHSDTGLGENLFYGSTTFRESTFTPTEAVFQWYSEHVYYDYNTASSVPGRNITDVGHFSQVVWSGTTSLGCGVATVYRGDSQNTYIVARYAPPGNFMGLFRLNVFPLKDGAVAPTLSAQLQ